MIVDILRKIHKPKYQPFNEIRVSSSGLLNNLKKLQNLQPQAEIFPVLKSNAYGHGLKEVCQILNKSKAKMIAVDSFPEAQIAYKYFKGKILIIGEMPLEAYKYTKLKRTEFIVYKEETLRYLANIKEGINIHLFVNSGMNREGIKDIDSFISRNKKYLDKVNIVGFCSHFAAADESENKKEFNEFQINNFFESLDKLNKAGYFPNYIHMSNSAAILSINDKRFTAYRPGLSFYGYSPFPNNNLDNLPVKPALEVFSKITHVYKIKKGETVSYNNEFRAEHDTNIGLIPFGYFEGLDKSLSNKIEFVVQDNNEDKNENNKEFIASIAGRVCMNLSCINLENKKIKNNTRVKIVSKNETDPNSIHNLSKLSNLSPYELLVRLQTNIRRVIID